MFGKAKRSPSSSPSLTLHSTHLARRRSPFEMAPALEKASDGLLSGPLLWGCARAFSWERAVAGWRPDAYEQRPHRARQRALRGTARSARRAGRRRAPGRLLADDRADRQLTTTPMSLRPSLPSSFQLAPDEVHSWSASLVLPPHTSARLHATSTPDERT